MDPSNIIGYITGIAKVAIEIKRIVDTVKANKQQCLVLNERAQIIAELVQKLRTGVQDLATFRASMEAAERCLNECLIFITGFTGAKWYKKVIAHGSHKDKFLELNDTLQKSISSFSLGVVIDLDIKQALDKQREIEAEEQDRAQLASMQELVLAEHKKEQAKLQRIYAMQKKMKKDATSKAVAEQRKAEFLEQQLGSIRVRLANIAVPAAAAQPASLPVDKSLLINLSDLDVLEVIGDGTIATVYAGKLYDIDIAIKKLKDPTPQRITELFREATILARLKGQGIIRCYGVCIEEGKECLVTELMPGGSLKEYLAELSKPLPPMLQKQWALEIAQGISCIHKQQALHRDLKTANILLSQDGHAKLADFDLAEMNTASIGTVEYTSIAYPYMAPELRRLNGKASPATDIYSYGVILWELLTRQQAPVEKEERLLATTTEPYKAIIARCWSVAPEARPKLEEIISQIEQYQPFDSRALYQQGTTHEQANRLQEAEQCYRQSASLGYSRSEFRLGMLFLQGKTGSQDKSQAFPYLQRAANQLGRDQAKACFNVAVMLEHGDGISQDLKEAYRYYSKAAELGNAEAATRAEALKHKIELNYQDNISSIGLVSSPVAKPGFK